jgi:hypothetical protein
MVDRQSKEYYQQQLAQAQAAWVGFSRGAGYPGSSSHPGFAAGTQPVHMATPYENYMQQLQQFAGLSSQSNAAAMFGGAAAASNFLGNGAKDMTAGFSSTPFGFNPGHHSMAAFSNIANYHRPLPAHSPLPAHMKNAGGGSGGGSTGPLPAHMRSNPYQQTNYHSLNSPYAPGAMNPNSYLQSNMMAAAAAAAASSSQSQGSGSSTDYMSQLAERTRQQFGNSDNQTSQQQQQQQQQQSAARQESARRAALLNGGSGAEAFNQLQQLQAAYSQAAATGLSSSLKEANSKNSNSSSKGPSNNNYAYYQANSAQAAASAASSSGMWIVFLNL